MRFDCIHHKLSHFLSPFTTFSKGIVNNKGNTQSLFAMFTEKSHFSIRVSSKAVKYHQHTLTKALQVVHMTVEVSQALTQALLIRFLNLVEVNTTVHLQALSCSHNHSKVGFKSTLTTKNVVELLSTQVSTEASLRNGIVGMTKRHTCSNKRVTTMCNVSKRSTMHNGRRILSSLHQVRLNSILEQHHDSTCYTKVFHREGLTLVSITQQNILNATAKVSLILCQTKNCHQFRSWRNVETSLLRNTIGSRT